MIPPQGIEGCSWYDDRKVYGIPSPLASVFFTFIVAVALVAVVAWQRRKRP